MFPFALVKLPPCPYTTPAVMGLREPAWDDPAATKLALTFSAEFTVKVHVALAPELAHAPPQPANVDVPFAVAVSVTEVAAL